jgi:hypothetical protein
MMAILAVINAGTNATKVDMVSNYCSFGSLWLTTNEYEASAEEVGHPLLSIKLLRLVGRLLTE